MSSSQEQSRITKLNRDIASLSKKDAAEAKKVAQSTNKLNKSQNQAQKASSQSAMNAKLREIERHSKDIDKALSRRANIADMIAKKRTELARVQEKLVNSQSIENKKREKLTKIKNDQGNRLKAIEKSAKLLPSQPINIANNSPSEPPQYDVFISHASEDKESFVKEFAELAIENGINIWYDELSIRWGDSLRQSIDKGLANSYFGVVILSQHFFAKRWTSYELDGLIDREMSGVKCVLPVWHNISKDEVQKHSPSLAARLALNTSNQSKQEIVDELKTRVDEIKSIPKHREQ